jgi:hypothetical protein
MEHMSFCSILSKYVVWRKINTVKIKILYWLLYGGFSGSNYEKTKYMFMSRE